MSSTQRDRLAYDDKPRFVLENVLNRLLTERQQPQIEVSGENTVVTHKVRDEGIAAVSETVAIGPREVQINHGDAFLDELMTLDEMRLAGESVRVTHWLFTSPAVEIKTLNYESLDGLGSDGGGTHLARATFDMSVVETETEPVNAEE